MTALRFEAVSFSYGERSVLRNVNLTIGPGERVALLGRNGVGKTTLTKLAVALLQPTGGTVWLGGEPTSGKAPEDVAHWAAYLFQHPDQQLFARSVLDELAFAPLQRGVDEAQARCVAALALQRMGLEHLQAEHPYDLSPAHRKLVTFAAALAQGSHVLVLDEPTQGLDRSGRTRVGQVIGDVAAQGTTVLAVSQDLGFVADVMDRAVVLADGVLAHDAPAGELVRDAERVAVLGLAVPPAARLSLALALPGAPVAFEAVAAALEERCRGRGRSVTSRSAYDQP